MPLALSPSATLLVPILALFLDVDSAFGQWAPNGIPVAPGRPSRQDIAVVAADGQGGLYVGWRDYSGTARADVYLQHLTSDGYFAAGWGPSALPVATGPAEETPIQTCADGFGGVIVSWIQATFAGYDLWALRVQSDGSVHPAWPPSGVLVAGGDGHQIVEAMIPDGLGGTFIAWEDERDRFSSAFIQHLGPDGQVMAGWPSGGHTPVNTPGQHGITRIASDGSGGIVGVVTEFGGAHPGTPSGRGTNHAAFRFTASGIRPPGWPAEGILLHRTLSGVEVRKMCPDGAGGVYFGWNDNRTSADPFNPLGYRVYAQHVLGEGRIDPRWPADGLLVGPGAGGQYDFDIGADGEGGAVAVWQDAREGNWYTYAQRLRPDGAPAPGWNTGGNRVSTNEDWEIFPLLVPDELGGFFVFWEMQYTGSPTQHYLRMGANGVVAPGWPAEGRPLSDVPNYYPVAIADGAHGALVAFERRSEDATGRRIRAQRVYGDGVTSALPSLISAESTPGAVALRWSVSGSQGGERVERRQAHDEWAPAGTARLVSPDLLEFTQSGLEEGRYAFRLLTSVEGRSQATPEVWLDVESGAPLRLSGFRPNPASSAATLVFSLPDDRAARLELIDVKGRVVHSRDIGGLGPGSHSLTLSNDARLAAGMYWIRLTHPERTLIAKGLVLP